MVGLIFWTTLIYDEIFFSLYPLPFYIIGMVPLSTASLLALGGPQKVVHIFEIF